MEFFTRAACPNFGHPTLNSEFIDYAHNIEFLAAVGKLVKNLNQHLNNFKTNSPFTILFFL